MFETDPLVLETALSYLWKREFLTALFQPKRLDLTLLSLAPSPATPADPNHLLPTLPSRSVLLALHSLVSSVQSLGPPPCSDLSNHGRDLYRAFSKKMIDLPGWTSRAGKGAVQSLWDLRMMQEVGGLFEEAEEDKELRESWRSVVHEVEKVVSSVFFVACF